MLNPYDLPHDCERESVAKALGKLSSRQRRVLRSYVRNVACGEMTLSVWIASAPDSVSLSSWRQPAGKGGNYWGTEDDPVIDFRAAANLYTDAWLGWETAEEEKALRKAGRALRMMAPTAAAQLASIIEKGQVVFDRADEYVVKQASVQEVLRATLSVLDRASADTASKSTTVQTMDADQFAALAQQAKGAAKPIEEAAEQAWDPSRKPDDGD
jgi:hypothetical protein